MTEVPLILRALSTPNQVGNLTLVEWDLLIRQARSGNLLARLWHVFHTSGVLVDVPAPPLRHLEWAKTVADRLCQAVHLEVRFIQQALGGQPFILLKGAAYVSAGLPPADGRLFSDIDILVSKTKIDMAESDLKLHGWIATHHDPYDQRYYRQWMHEVPPLQNVKRGTVVDLHHAILPLTMAVHPDPDKLRASALPVPGAPGLHVLAPIDMILHSAAHLFYESESLQGLRDLCDLDSLLRHFGTVPGIWERMVDRAVELELTRVLFYALRYTQKYLLTPIPDAVVAAAEAGRPSAAVLYVMDGIYRRMLLPAHFSCTDHFSGVARKALYLRGTWLRMPPWLLMRHLFHKAFITPKPA